jgi:hypothetical protein
LGHVVPEIVTSATFEIADLRLAQDNPDRVLVAGAAVVPAYTLTLTGDAGPSEADSQLIPTGATAGPSIGDPVIIEAADGSREPLAIEAISTDAYVRSSSILAGTYTTGDTIKGSRITATTTAALHDFEDALDDQRPLSILWSYETAAGLVRVSETIELRRGTHATATVGAAIQAINRRWPDMKSRLTRGLTIDALAEDALEQVETDLSTRGQDHASIMQGTPGKRLLVAKILAEAALSGYQPGQRDLSDFYEDARKGYNRQLEALTSGRGSTQTTALDTEHTSHSRPDQRSWGPLLAQ